jgi:glycerol-3-phosphate O-acyltransferase
VTSGPEFSGDLCGDHDGPILFIVDAQNALERRLLNDSLDQAIASGRIKDSERVSLNIATGRDRRGLGRLAASLRRAPQTLLVPVRLSWLVPAQHQESNEPLALRHLLLGDPRQPGNLKGRWILLRDSSRAQCIAAEPATIDNLQRRFEEQQAVAAEEPSAAFASFVARQAGLALEIAEWGLRGRRYKVPRFVAESLNSSPKFRAAVEDLSRETSRSTEDLYREADAYLKELVAVPSTLFVDMRARLDNWVLSLGYNKNVVCRPAELERLREIIQTKPTMLLFTHKTYIDSIALTAKLFENDFPMVHIFAGANMGFAGLGFLMRRSGGIFIRRSFQDKPLYKIVLRHYIGYLMEKRFPMTWAFEGTRSRTGKLMPPRYGLLKYVLEAARATDARDINVVPVTVSYDLMRDVEEYATEQTGRIKKPESLKWFVSYLSSLRQPMGRMYLDLGEPVVLEQAPDPEDKMVLPKIAFEVAVAANRVTPITLPAIGCMVLLGAAPRALTLREIQREVLAHMRWARDRGIRLSNDFSAERLAQVRELADSMVETGLLMRYDEGSETVFGIEPEKHPMASYYRNTIIHHFLNKAILEMALLKAADVPADEALTVFWNETERLRDAFKFEFFYPRKKHFRRELKEELGRTDPEWLQRLEQGGQNVTALLDRMHPLVAHASLLPYVEAYTVVFDLLARLDASESLEQAYCVSECLKMGRQLYLQRRITSEASIGKLLFTNGYKLASNQGLTMGGGSERSDERLRLLREFKELSRRLDRIRLLALSENQGA